MLTSAKDLLRTGGVATNKVAVAVFPVPKRDVTLPVVFTMMPSVELTVTVMVQELLAGITPPARVIVLEPALAVTPGGPPHVLFKPLDGVVMVTPGGRWSMTPTPPNVAAFGFEMTRVSAEIPPGRIFVGVKDLLMAGGRAVTVIASCSLATAEPSTRALIENGYTPGNVPVNVTVKVNVRVTERS
jgi:hypothetical protein